MAVNPGIDMDYLPDADDSHGWVSPGRYRIFEEAGIVAVVKRSILGGNVQNVKLSTSVNVRVFMQSSTDGLGLSGLVSVMTVSVCKSGQTSFSTITPVITDLSNGWYNLALTTTHTNTLGVASFHVTATGAFPNDELNINVVAYDPADANALGLSTISLPAGSILSDAGNTALTFKTDLTSTVSDFCADAYLVLTSGTLINEVK